MEEYKVNLLKLMAYWDLHDELYWSRDLDFFIKCSDVFAWGYADCEKIASQVDVDLLEEAIGDCREIEEMGQFSASMLYVARKRGMRPQGAMYEHIPVELHKLFDHAGPERKVGVGNPVARNLYSELTEGVEALKQQRD
jgi:hypothetical protein